MMPICSLTAESAGKIAGLISPDGAVGHALNLGSIATMIYDFLKGNDPTIQTSTAELEAQLDPNLQWLGTLIDGLKIEEKMMDDLMNEYDKEVEKYDKALELFLDCCPEFQATKIKPPIFECNEPNKFVSLHKPTK